MWGRQPVAAAMHFHLQWTKHLGTEGLLRSSDVNGSLQFLLTVVLEIHEFRVSKDEPAHLPVPAGQSGHPSTFLVQPAWLERILLCPEPHEGLVFQNTPAPAPRDHQPTLKKKNKKQYNETFIYPTIDTFSWSNIIQWYSHKLNNKEVNGRKHSLFMYR